MKLKRASLLSRKHQTTCKQYTNTKWYDESMHENQCIQIVLRTVDKTRNSISKRHRRVNQRGKMKSIYFRRVYANNNNNARKNMDSTTSNKLIQEALCLLLEVQETLYTKLRLHPLEELRKIIQVVEYKNKRQFHLVDRWLFELVRMFYDAGYLRGVSEETCDFILCKIERIQSLLKKASE